jgi:predicted TIM-barrel fold metal-dependent hydrolase
MRIIDAHMHLGRGDEHYGKQALWDQKAQFLADDMKSLLDQVGIDHAVVFGLGRATEEDRVRPVLDAVQRYPERFTGFFWANPWETGSRAAFVRAVREYGLRGLKLHPIIDSYQANHSVVFPLLEAAGELGVPVTIHSHQPGSQPALIGDLANRFPTVTVIMAHMGMAAYKDAIYVAQKEPNIILETSAQPWTHRIIRGAADKIGVHRIVYGSDAPLHHPKVELTKIEVAGLDPEQRALVLGGNIARIVGIAQPAPTGGRAAR